MIPYPFPLQCQTKKVFRQPKLKSYSANATISNFCYSLLPISYAQFALIFTYSQSTLSNNYSLPSILQYNLDTPNFAPLLFEGI